MMKEPGIWSVDSVAVRLSLGRLLVARGPMVAWRWYEMVCKRWEERIGEKDSGGSTKSDEVQLGAKRRLFGVITCLRGSPGSCFSLSASKNAYSPL